MWQWLWHRQRYRAVFTLGHEGCMFDVLNYAMHGDSSFNKDRRTRPSSRRRRERSRDEETQGGRRSCRKVQHDRREGLHTSTPRSRLCGAQQRVGAGAVQAYQTASDARSCRVRRPQRTPAPSMDGMRPYTVCTTGTVNTVESTSRLAEN